MLLLQILLINVLALVFAAGVGWLPARMLRLKSCNQNLGAGFFHAVLLGFILTQSLYAIWITRGLSMQWLNFLPFIILAGMPSRNSLKQNGFADYRRDLLITGIMLLICSLYFLRSYSHDFIHIDRYPFIDLVSYAASAYGMGQSGSEVYFSDMALYYPGLSRLDLYHFTELWFVRLVCDLSGQTELWVVCFILPVFSICLLVAALLSLPETRKQPAWLMFILVFSFCFAFGKLLFFEDAFLFHVLDLFGQKISFIIPLLLFLWSLRLDRHLFLSFLLILPQVNILLGVPVAVLAAAGFFFFPGEKFRIPPLKIWVLYFVYAAGFFTLLSLGKGQDSGSLQAMPFSFGKAVSTFFQYGREALYNLGFLYWSPFLLLAGLFRNRIYILVLIPFFAGKAVGKLLPEISPSLVAFIPGLEWVAGVAVLFWINRRYTRFPGLTEYLFLLIFFLCGAGALGYAFSGFMDFEQIYTLMATSLFFIFAFVLFILPVPEKYPPLLRFRYKDLVLVILLLALTFKTFRYQRALNFDQAFYNNIRKEAAPVSRSIFFTGKRYAPFPLHVKAGFPLLFYYPDAHSTPVTQFEDSSWRGKNIAWHVMQYPFYHFCTQPENSRNSLSDNTLQFIRKNGIRFVWIDETYPESRLGYLKPFVKREWKSSGDKLTLWKLRLEEIPSSAGFHSTESKVDSRP